ncbi:MAG: YfaP family protein [Verrucomicrobia bacterium]|nr:YfaP family protein [Verrucomicrobiota bacterium]MBU4248531.1 YfaP family protein [Verrucomicrobiota bacterium]MBU4290204.1 YfaP family protein [Verrucomicrobiota bacterium]MBU4497950.1 YfaP family protein [Verrucomicrobiota bacterium]MCG2681716.1 YfaP family protein [Kiritimatiellia bacterium]
MQINVNSRFFEVKALREDALDWDVLGHEYAHYLANKGASSLFANSPGGPHDGSSTIPSNGKEKGIRLAWSEGWATFFEILAQIEPTQNLLALPAIPNAGDRIYHDTEDGAVADDLETFSNTGLTGAGQGYACEYSISGMLYDLCDGDVDTSVDGLSQDLVNVTMKQIWNIFNMADLDNVGKFYNALCVLVGYDVNTMLLFSQIFDLNNIGPELQTPAEGLIVSSVVSPEFKWQANGDPTAGYAHDRFALVIAKNNFTEIVGIKDDILDIKYTFTDDEWAAIASQSDDTGKFQWVVLGYNSLDPRMPADWALGKFISNMQSFQLRAYHVRLTWTTLGADVDLHLSPPSGTDCYYANRNPDWGVQGDVSDDPSLDRDCITSCTEENITLDKVVDPGTYQVWVHYYSDHDMGATTATIEVFKYGQSIGVTSQGLSETGDRWDVFSFSVGASAAMTIKENSGGVIHGVVSPAPKKQDE